MSHHTHPRVLRNLLLDCSEALAAEAQNQHMIDTRFTNHGAWLNSLAGRARDAADAIAQTNKEEDNA